MARLQAMASTSSPSEPAQDGPGLENRLGGGLGGTEVFDPKAQLYAVNYIYIYNIYII